MLRHVEQIPHARGANADEHLDEVRAGHGEERRPALAGGGLGQQRLARAGGATSRAPLGILAPRAVKRAGFCEGERG